MAGALHATNAMARHPYVTDHWKSNCTVCSISCRSLYRFWNVLKLPDFLLDLLWCLLVVVSSVTCHRLNTTLLV